VGWIVAVVVFLLLNGGPRLAKHLLRKRHQRNQPAQVKEQPKRAIKDEQNRAIDEAVREMERQNARQRAIPEPVPVVVPPGAP
jgi:hypothetical protein